MPALRRFTRVKEQADDDSPDIEPNNSLTESIVTDSYFDEVPEQLNECRMKVRFD